MRDQLVPFRITANGPSQVQHGFNFDNLSRHFFGVDFIARFFIIRRVIDVFFNDYGEVIEIIRHIDRRGLMAVKSSEKCFQVLRYRECR